MVFVSVCVVLLFLVLVFLGGAGGYLQHREVLPHARVGEVFRVGQPAMDRGCRPALDGVVKVAIPAIAVAMGPRNARAAGVGVWGRGRRVMRVRMVQTSVGGNDRANGGRYGIR